MIGSLGDVIFTSSTERVLTFRAFERAGGPRVEEHAVIGRKPVLEVVGPGLSSIGFSIRMDAFLGVDPSRELGKLREALEAGEALPLSIGGEYLGRWLITEASETHTRHDGKGGVLVAEVSLSLLEVAEEAPGGLF